MLCVVSLCFLFLSFTSQSPPPFRSLLTRTGGLKRAATWTKPEALAAFKILEDKETNWNKRRLSALPSWRIVPTKQSPESKEWMSSRDSETGRLFFTEASTGRSTWLAPKMIEFRIADDGNAYTRSQFEDHYGGLEEWTAAEVMPDQIKRPISIRPASAMLERHNAMFQEDEDEEEEEEDDDFFGGGGSSRPMRVSAGSERVVDLVVGGALRQSMAKHINPLRPSAPSPPTQITAGDEFHIQAFGRPMSVASRISVPSFVEHVSTFEPSAAETSVATQRERRKSQQGRPVSATIEKALRMKSASSFVGNPLKKKKKKKKKKITAPTWTDEEGGGGGGGERGGGGGGGGFGPLNEWSADGNGI